MPPPLPAASASPGTAARESALPSPKQLGEWFINHGIFLKTCGRRLPAGAGPVAAVTGHFGDSGHRALPSQRGPGGGFWGRPHQPMVPARGGPLLSPSTACKASWQHPKVLGARGLPWGPSSPRGAAARHHNQRALLRGFFGFCHCSRSIPLIAVNYFGINGDVLCTSPINEASRMNALANISW